MAKARNPRTALRVGISRCRSLLAALEDNEFPDDESTSKAAYLVGDAKNALTAAEKLLRPPRKASPQAKFGRY